MTDMGAAKSTRSKDDLPKYGNFILPSPTFYRFSAYGIGDLGVRVTKLDANRLAIVKSFRGAQTCTFLPFHHCFPVPGTVTKKAYVFDGTGWVATPQYVPPIPFVTQYNSTSGPSIDEFVQLLDINGSGLPSIVANFTDPVSNQVTNKVWLNTGSGWDGNNSIQVPYRLDAVYWEPKTLVQMIDVNGDGLPDLVMTKGGCANCSRTWLATGKGWTEKVNWRVSDKAMGGKDGNPGFRLIDINGDGYVDILWMHRKDDGSFDKGILVNNGSGWKDPSTPITIPEFRF